MNRKKTAALIGTAVIMLSAAGGLFLYHSVAEKDDAVGQSAETERTDIPFAGMITAGGSTSVGMQEEIFTLDCLETELKIEEVYLSSQDQVEKGTAILKLTEESVNEARRELEKKAAEADYACRQRLLDGEEEKITAEQTRQASVVQGNYADYTYAEALREYEEEIASLQEQVEEAQKLADEYAASVENDYYCDYYGVVEKKETFEKSFAVLMQLYEEWNVSWLEDQYTISSSLASGDNTGQMAQTASSDMSDATAEGNGGMNGGSSPGSSESAGGNSNGNSQKIGLADDNYGKLYVYQMLDQEVQENEQIYKQAVEDYERARDQAESSLDQARCNLELLKTRLEEEQLAFERKRAECISDRETAAAGSSQAQEVYESELRRIEEEQLVAENEREEAEQNLKEFEELLGDGCLYTQGAGTVMLVAVREDSTLAGNSLILAYSDPETVTVTASVGQSDIASLSVGQKAVVQIADHGVYDGTVKSINPISQSEGRTGVYYTVIVALEGDIRDLSANLSATVLFETGGTENAGETSSKKQAVLYLESRAERGTLVQGIEESGSITLEEKEILYDLDINSSEDEEEANRYLQIEEIYVVQGQHVSEGEPLMKITADSLDAVRRKLENAVSEAQLALTEAENDYNTQLISAQGILGLSRKEAELALRTYQNDIQASSLEIELMYADIEVLEAQINDYNEWLTDEDTLEEYTELQSTYERAAEKLAATDPANVEAYAANYADCQSARTAFEQLEETLQGYRDGTEENLELIREKLEEIEKAQEELPGKESQARQVYDSAVLGGELADDIYGYTVQALQNSVEEAQAEREEAADLLEQLESFAGEEGIIYAEEDGLITQVGYEAGDRLTGPGVLLAYAVDNSCTITVDVSEEDISGIKVGDPVDIEIIAREESREGTVTAVGTAASASYSTTVNYPVTVRVEGDTDSLFGGMSADVIFVTERAEDVIYISARAVRTNDKGDTSVYVKNDVGQMEERKVETGFTNGSDVEIISGLAEGDIVYMESAVRAGESEKILKQTPDAQTDDLEKENGNAENQ